MVTGFSPARTVPSLPRTGIIKPAPSTHWHSGSNSTPRMRLQPAGNFVGTSCLTNPSYSDSFFCRQVVPRRRFFFGQPLFMPYYWNPPIEYSSVEETPAAAPTQENSLVSQVERLVDEVELLREEQAARQAMYPPTAPAPAAVEEKPLSTVLVYRDGHQREVQDYALLGQTLWVFAGQTTRRISLADLDLEATKRLNDERGVDFVAPDAR